MDNELMIISENIYDKVGYDCFAADFLGNVNIIPHLPEEVIIECIENARKLVMPFPDATEDQLRAMEMTILEIYKEWCDQRSNTGVIAFTDIFSAVDSYNTDLIQEIADAEFTYITSKNYMEDDWDEEEIEDFMGNSGHEICCHLCEEWREIYLLTCGQGFHFDEYVMNVLDKHKCAYSFEKYDIPYDNTMASSIIFRTDKMATFVANDAQNVLLPEFMFFGFGGYSDYLNYHKENDLSGNLLTTGSLLGDVKKNE